MQQLQQPQQVQTDSFHIRPAESFDYTMRLERPWGWLDQAIAWCKTEMTGEWRWQIVSMSSDQRPGDYIFYFDTHRDYFTFCLKFQ